MIGKALYLRNEETLLTASLPFKVQHPLTYTTHVCFKQCSKTYITFSCLVVPSLFPLNLLLFIFLRETGPKTDPQEDSNKRTKVVLPVSRVRVLYRGSFSYPCNYPRYHIQQWPCTARVKITNQTIEIFLHLG